MKKIIKILLYTILVIFIGGFVFLYVYYHTYSPERDDVDILKENLVYYQEAYDESRNAFLTGVADVKRRFKSVKTSEFQVPSDIDSNLVMDLCYIPPQQDTNRLFVLISGTHGIEGYTGSAIQQMFMKEFLDSEIVEDMGILLIHSFNPYGQKYYRKATEFNVDLNRNCGLDKSLFENKNPGFGDIYDMLCPGGKVNKNSLRNRFFYLVAIYNILKESMATLRQAALQGQWEFPEGFYYGGDDFTPQTVALQSIFPEVFEPYGLIFAIDLHTAYGEWAKLHLFPNPEKDEEIKSLTESLFEGHHIDWGDTEDFYTIVGDLSGFIKMIKPDAITLCMPFEFGTMNSQETIGSLQSVQRMILENQGFNYGFKNQKSEEKVLHDFREMYYPNSEAWRSEVIRQAREMLEFCLARYLVMETGSNE